ncbi:MAG: hypothetical protein ACI4F8_02780 [Lachnospiraceae bacterium]
MEVLENNPEELKSIEDMTMREKCIALSYLLGRYMQFVLVDKRQNAVALVQDMVVYVSEVFPRFIAVYDDPRMEEYAQDREYWAMQIGRITEALSEEDVFHQIDVLFFETRANLLEILTILEEKGIEL